MASIRERISADGKKSYHVQVRVRTFPPQTKSFDKLAAAKQWASLVESELRSGRYLPRVESARHTVQDLVCWRRLNLDSECQSNFDRGLVVSS
jgi:hypothetical protein